MIEKINKDNPEKGQVKKAEHWLNKGVVIIMPTETCYGIACDATNAEAIAKIYDIKERDRGKFLPMVVASAEQLSQYFEMSDEERAVMEKYDGLTMILKPKLGAQKKDVVLLPGQDACAVRVSTNNFVRQLAKKLGRPIIATSANIAGGDSSYDVGSIQKQIVDLEDKVSLVLDAGKLKKKKPSTIVRVNQGKVEVLRQGEVVIE